MRRLKALFLLGLRALFLHPLRALFTAPERKGKRGFLRSYAPDGLVPYSAADRAQLLRFSGCINCGLCDAVCPLLSRLPAREFRGPSLVALAYSRATPGLTNLRVPLAALDGCGACTLCRDVCPRAVPLLELFAFTRQKLIQIDAARELA